MTIQANKMPKGLAAGLAIGAVVAALVIGGSASPTLDIRNDVICHRSVASATIHPREIVRRALELGAMG